MPFHRRHLLEVVDATYRLLPGERLSAGETIFLLRIFEAHTSGL